MRNSKVFRGVAAVLAVMALGLVPALAVETVTIGDYLVELAKVRNLPATDVATAQAALQASGVNLGTFDTSKTLTQGDVVTLSSAAGLELSSSTPDEAFTDDQLSSFFTSFGTELGGSQEEANTPEGRFNDNGADPRTKGKGKKKGLFKSPSEPL